MQPCSSLADYQGRTQRLYSLWRLRVLWPHGLQPLRGEHQLRRRWPERVLRRLRETRKARRDDAAVTCSGAFGGQNSSGTAERAWEPSYLQARDLALDELHELRALGRHACRIGRGPGK